MTEKTKAIEEALRAFMQNGFIRGLDNNLRTYCREVGLPNPISMAREALASIKKTKDKWEAKNILKYPRFSNLPYVVDTDDGAVVCKMGGGDCAKVEDRTLLIAAAPETAMERDRLKDENEALVEALKAMNKAVCDLSIVFGEQTDKTQLLAAYNKSLNTLASIKKTLWASR